MLRITSKRQYPFLSLCTALIAGILCNGLLCVPTLLFYLFFFISLFILFPIRIFTFPDKYLHWERRLKSTTDLFLLSAVFSLGLLITQREPPSTAYSGIQQFKLYCEEELTYNNHILSYRGNRLFLSGFDAGTQLRPGDSLLFDARILPLPENSNPGAFSYNQYLKQKNVHYKVVPCSEIKITGHSRDLHTVFEDLRATLLCKTARLFPDTTVRALINALCLGYKNDLDKNIQNLFIQTGTIHLLAVSGLHTGAVYLLLVYLFHLTGLSPRKTDLFVIPLLWCYACLTGLSPSVVRAATILTFIAAGKTFGRDYTPLNAIAASAFLTLVVQPHLISSVSFLMSYSAYTGIIVIYRFLNRLPSKLPAFPSKLWALCSVSLAAQIPTLPIAAFYFHTVNVNSVLINLVAIPLTTVILYASIILLLIPGFIGMKIAFTVTLLCKFLYKILELFEPVSLNITGLYPTTTHLFLLYTSLIFVIMFLYQRNKTTFRASALSLCTLLIFSCAYNVYLSSRKEIIVFNHHQHSTILLNEHGYYSILRNTLPDSGKIIPYIQKNNLKPLPPHSGLLSHRMLSGKQGIKSDGQTVCIASPGSYIFPETDVLIVTHNVLPEEFFSNSSSYPSTIIIDGSSSYFNTRRWKKFCSEKNIFFQNTMDIGGVSIPLK